MLSSLKISNILSSARLILNNSSRPAVSGTIVSGDNFYSTVIKVPPKTIEERLGLPPKPKKPLTPYFRFMKQMRPEIRAKDPKISIIDTIKVIAKRWETVDPTTKKKLEEEYKNDQIQFIEKRAEYDSKLTDAQRIDIKLLKDELAEAKDKRLHRKKVKQLGRPKKPASAFLRYLSEQRTKLPQSPNETYRDWQKKIAAKWTEFSDKEKEKYVVASHSEYGRYKLEISKWEEEMVKQGNLDVVRQEALIETLPPKPRRFKVAKNE